MKPSSLAVSRPVTTCIFFLVILASTSTTLCVFFPLIFVQGMMGIVFQELALTVAFALLASLLVALTLVPMLSSRWLHQTPQASSNGAATSRFQTAWVQAMFAQAGLSFRGGGGTHSGFLWVRLVDRSKRQDSLKDVLNVLRKKLSHYPDATVRIVERPSDVARLLGSSRSERVEIDVFGFDLKRGRQLAQQIEREVKAIAGISYTHLNIDDSRPEMQISIDRQKASAQGINVREILSAVESSIAGTVASKFREGRDV